MTTRKLTLALTTVLCCAILAGAVRPYWVGQNPDGGPRIVDGGVAQWDTLLIAITAIPAYTSIDSTKAGGGRFDYIVHNDNAPGEVIDGIIAMDQPAAVQLFTTVAQVRMDDESYWSLLTNIHMDYFPLDDLPGFIDGDTEVISATYTIKTRQAYTLAATDSIFIVGGNRADILWHESGAFNSSRDYMNSTGTTNWPIRNSSTDPIDWLGLDAISTLDYADHPSVTNASWGDAEAVDFNLLPWAADMAAGGVNGGLWYSSILNTSTIAKIFRFINTSNTDETQNRPILIMRYRVRPTPLVGAKMAVFSDNHSNRFAIEMMGNAIDAAGFDPTHLIHNGDSNDGGLCADADTSIADQDTLASYWKSIPIQVTGGNHEAGTGTCSQFYLEVLPGASLEFIDDLAGIGGSVANLGDDTATPPMTYHNYSYDIGGVHITQMYHENYPAAGRIIDADDVAWVYDDLISSTAQVKLLFFHWPSVDGVDLDFPLEIPAIAHFPIIGWDDFQTAIEAGGVTAVFSGHRHIAYYNYINGVDYFGTPSTAKAESQAHQGFITLSIGKSGRIKLDLYRGYNSEGEYVFTRTLLLGTGVEAIAIPDQITNVVASAEVDGISLVWDASGDADLDPTNPYAVWRSAVTDGPYTFLSYSSDTAHLDDGLGSGATFYYVVTAQNVNNNHSPNSDEDSATSI